MRVATSAVAIPLLLGVDYLGGWAFAFLAGAAALVGAAELCRLLRGSGATIVWPVSIAAAATIAVVPAGVRHPQAAWIAILLGGLLAAASYQLLPHIHAQGRPAWALTMLPPLYVGLPLGLLHLLRQAPRGAWWVLVVLLITWAYDTGAYFTGRTIGRRPFMQHISAKKTREGVAGGLIASSLVGLAAVPAVSLPVWQGLLLGLAGGVLAQIGDLVESMIKRQSGEKDAGRLIPGHGGLLDRIDSLLFTAVLGYYAAVLAGHAP